MTANDEITLEEVADIYVRDLDLTVTAYINDKSPRLISVGQLCKDNCRFRWDTQSQSILRIHDKDGNATKEIELGESCNVPYCLANTEYGGKKPTNTTRISTKTHSIQC